MRHRLTLSLVVSTMLAPPAAAEIGWPEMGWPEIGWQSLSVPAPQQPAPLEGVMLYPAVDGGTATDWAANPVFEGVTVRRNAAIARGPLPVVLLSHGLGGHLRTLSWLAAGLAERGAMVVAVNHPGSTTGDFDMARSLVHGSRAADLSAVIDALLADPELAPEVDADRLYVAGFSYGGFTALSLAGLAADLEGYARHCRQVGEASSHCADIRRAGVDLATLDETAWNADHADERIKAAAAIDPGLTYGLPPEAAAGIEVPVLLITLGDGEDRLLATDIGEEGSGFAAMLPAARHEVIAPAAHFTALPVCTPAGAAILAEEGDDPVCTDPPGTDRAAVHGRIIEAMSEIFGLESAD